MTTSLLSVFFDRAACYPDRVAMRVLADGRVVTWGEWAEGARRFAAALRAGGVIPVSSVAVFAGNRPAWPIADLGALAAGMVGVGLYPTSAVAQVRQVMGDCAAAVAVVDTPERLAQVLAARAGGALPALRTVVAAEGAEAAAAAAAAGLPDERGVEVVGWREWLGRGARALAADPSLGAAVERAARGVDPEGIAVLIYTSGSTGEPKGARISHRYLAASAASVRDTLGLGESDTTLSFLPFCHAGERVFGLYTRVLCGMEAALVDDASRVWDAAHVYRPTLFGGLPRVYEKLHERLEEERAAAPDELRQRWERTLLLGRERSRRRRGGGAVPPELEGEWAREGAPAFAHVRAHFGGRMRLATSGGATLPAEVAEYLDALGVTVLGAYGLTEHLCAAFNRPDCYDFATAGPPMPGTVVRIAEDGEVLLRCGALTFSGYHGRDAETREAFTPDGEWLRTGDVGALDERGALRVLGRKKELIALSTGKKVAPLPIEAKLAEDPFIAQAVLHGEGRKFISALIALRRPAVEAWARERGMGGVAYAELLRHPGVVARVQDAVDRVNALVSRTEGVRQFALLERELSVEEDELTPTMKVRRVLVAEKFRGRLDALYAEPRRA